MGSFSDFVIYADESGDHNLVRTDPHFPIFVLALCLFRKTDYIQTVVPAIQHLKFDWFGHDMVVLHEHEIVKQKPPFKFLQNIEKRQRFMRDVTSVVCQAPMTVIAAVIDKPKLNDRYESPEDPYALSLKFCLERAQKFLHEHGQQQHVTHCIFERRGDKEDQILERAYRRIVDGGNFRGDGMRNLQLLFADKKVNSAGLQLADLVARPIGLKQLRPDQPNKAYDVIETKFRRSSNGQVQGYGLKVFP